MGHRGHGDDDESEKVLVALPEVDPRVHAIVMVFTCFDKNMAHVRTPRMRAGVRACCVGV